MNTGTRFLAKDETWAGRAARVHAVAILLKGSGVGLPPSRGPWATSSAKREDDAVASGNLPGSGLTAEKLRFACGYANLQLFLMYAGRKRP